MEMSNTIVVDTKATRCRRRHGIVDSLERVHATKHIAAHCREGDG